MIELSPQTFRALAGIIRQESGIRLGQEKSYLVRHRLDPLILSAGLNNYDDLVARLNRRDGTVLRNSVIDAITVKETSFFRDPGCFSGLSEKVLPAFAQAMAMLGHGRHQIRIWSAATATGQEAYSVAMLVREFITANAGGPDVSQFTVLASDLSPTAITAAKAGRYTGAEVRRGLSEARLRQHCHQRGGLWHINETVRRLVQFRTFNLLQPLSELAGGGSFDLILCRNVLIYFDEVTRRKICRELYAALQCGGWLVLGSAEGLYGMDDRFETLIQGRTILHRKPSLVKHRAI